MKTKTFAIITALTASAVALSCSEETTPAAEEPASTAPEKDAAPSTPEKDSGEAEADAPDSGSSGKCADAFGDKLTEGFGRIDGVVYAVQKPSDAECTMPNSDHVIVQVLMGGAVYRLVTNVESNGADPNVRYAVLPHAMPAPAFAEGWHEGVALDYPTTLDAHNDAFTPYPMGELVTKVGAELHVGDAVSIYAHSGKGRPESAHKIHRNSGPQQDGAIVVDPTGSPKFLLFHFADQVF